MTYIVLARKYRPQSFDEVISQSHITDTLKNAIEMDRIAHAYLFTGSRGVGKTSMARIFAKALNCTSYDKPTTSPCNKCLNCKDITNGSSVDVIEIDGASNTGVEDVRALQREIMYAPQNSRYKIYIIDEVHMLSKNAFNALLKTLEEPPENIIFIFATTEPHKILSTIISRCQRFDFRRIPIKDIVNKLKNIANSENIEVDDDSLFLIAKKADGSMRDALSLMDQLISFQENRIDKKNILHIFGIIHIEVYTQIIQAIVNKDAKKILEVFYNTIQQGNDIQEFIQGLMEYIRNLLLIKLEIYPEEIHKDNRPTLKKLSKKFTENDLLFIISLLSDVKEHVKRNTNPVLYTEIALVKLTNFQHLQSIDKLIKKINEVPEQSSLTITEPTNMAKNSVQKSQTGIQKREIKSEEKKVQLKQITEEILKQEWEKIKQMISKKYPVLGASLQNMSIESIRNNFIHFEVYDEFDYNNIKKRKEYISKALSDYFDLDLRVDFHFKATENKQEFITDTRFDTIKKYSPELAKFIERVDGRIVSQKRID